MIEKGSCALATGSIIIRCSCYPLRSTRQRDLKEKPPTFRTIDLFIEELVNLLKHFNIQDGFDLAGHFWGGILASEFEVRKFEVRRRPAGLKHLIITSSLAASSLWNQSNGQHAGFLRRRKTGLDGWNEGT